MKITNKFGEYFRFYYRLTGKRLIVTLMLSVAVSVLDGIGLAMFMPLLQATGSDNGVKSKEALGSLHFITDFIQAIGFRLNIYTVLFFLVILFITKGIMKFMQLNYQVNTRHFFMKKVRYMLINDLESISYKGFLQLDAGRIHNTLTVEVSRLMQSMNNYFNAAQNVVMLSSYIVLAFIANFEFAIFVVVGAGLSNLIYRKIYQICRKISLQLSQQGNSFNSLLVQAVHNYKYLKSTNYLHRFSQKIKNVIDKTEYLNKRIGFYNAITNSVKEPIMIIIIVGVIIIKLYVLGGTITSIMLSLLLFYRSINFLMQVQNEWQGFIQASGGITTVTTMLSEMEAQKEVQPEKMFKQFNQQIHIREVTFSYGATKILNKIDLLIPKNETIALVGESGSGKTTLANIISGLLQPTTGHVMLDNVSLKDLNLNSYRSRIGYISQEPVIFNDDVFNNITFWAEPTKENIEKFWKIVELASLTTFINQLADNEKTILGDNGMLISGGQKQRISIARELYKEVDILILDEATSALDSETEKVIQYNIEKLHGSYTIIIIAHRLSTIKNADIIYLLEKGNVLEYGSFDTMLNTSNRFKRMVALQEMQSPV